MLNIDQKERRIYLHRLQIICDSPTTILDTPPLKYTDQLREINGNDSCIFFYCVLNHSICGVKSGEHNWTEQSFYTHSFHHPHHFARARHFLILKCDTS